MNQLVQYFKRYDFTFWGTIGAIFFIGLLNLYSATHSKDSANLGFAQLQLLWFIFAFLIGFAVSLVPPKNLFRIAYPAYLMNLLLLIIVLALGSEWMGAKRWLAIGPIRFQPSELMKLTMVMALAMWFSQHEPERSLNLKRLVMPFLIVAIPAGLIIKQPDLGTGLVLLLIFAVLVFYRRIKVKTLLLLLFIGSITVPVVYQYGLKDYQRRRIITFLDPSSDAKGSGYNAIQSEIAIGSGQLFGKGFKKSSQASLNYLPENHTDFVFSVYNEEHGFFGALVLMVLYVILLIRMLWLSTTVLKIFDSVLTVGILGLLFWHTIINMSMVMGLMPIVGLPLPFMSYGGSAMLTFCLGLGMVTSVSNSRNLF